MVATTGSSAVASAVGVLDLGPRDDHGHGVVLPSGAGAGLALPSPAAVFRVAAGAGMEVGPGRAARGLLDSRAWNHVVGLPL